MASGQFNGAAIGGVIGVGVVFIAGRHLAGYAVGLGLLFPY